MKRNTKNDLLRILLKTKVYSGEKLSPLDAEILATLDYIEELRLNLQFSSFVHNKSDFYLQQEFEATINKLDQLKSESQLQDHMVSEIQEIELDSYLKPTTKPQPILPEDYEWNPLPDPPSSPTPTPQPTPPRDYEWEPLPDPTPIPSDDPDQQGLNR